MKNNTTKLKTKVLVVGVMTLVGLFGSVFIPANTVEAQYAVPTCNSVTLNGNVTPNGSATQVWFEWGPGSSIIYSTPHQTFTSNSTFSQLITGLNPSSTYSYRAMASNPNGTATGQTISFTTSACAPTTIIPTVTLNANPSSIQAGQNATVSWVSQNAVSCNLAGFGSVSTSGSRVVTPSTTTTYNITCTSATGQTASDSAMVTVTQPAPQVCQDPTATNYGGALPCQYKAPAPTVSITANPMSVQYNGSSTVSWTSQNATSCTATGGSNGWAGNRSTSGSFYTSALTNTTTYNITCYNNTRVSANDSVTVTVGGQPVQTCQDPSATNYGGALPCHYPVQTCQDPSAINYGGTLPCRYNVTPTVSITANPMTVAYNGASTVSWSSTNATSCTASAGTNGWSGARSTAGSFYTGALTNSTNFNITCYSSTGQQAFDSVTVSVGAQPAQTCQDPSATNYGGALPCHYPVQTCQDPSAINYGGTLPCRYNTPPQTCTDPSATNYGGALPCHYPVIAALPTVNITADNTSVNYNGTTNVRWTSTNATSCTATNGTNGWAGSRSVSGSFYTGNLVTGTTYSITCVNSAGQSATDSVTVNVSNAAPTVTLTADTISVPYNGNTNLRWASTNATSCTSSIGTLGWAGTRSLSGSFYTGNLTNTTTYNITCYNAAGQQAIDSVTITVGGQTIQVCQDTTAINYGGALPCRYNTPPQTCTDPSATNYGGTLPCRYQTLAPTVNIYANPTNVQYNGSSTVTWNSTNADYCTASGGTNGWSGSRSTSGSFYTGAMTYTTTFNITCTNSTGGSANASVTVYVNNQPQQPPVNNQPTVVIYADQTNLAYNGSTTVRWSTTNATYCNATGGSIGWAGVKSIGPGSFFTGSLTSTRTFGITCSNGSGSASDFVTVSVRGQVLGTTITRTPTATVLVTSTVDRNRPIVPTLDNTNPCPGDEINYSLTYQNVGNASVSNLVLRVDLPSEVQYESSTPFSPSQGGQTVIFNLGTLRANGTGTVTIRVRVQNNIPAGTPLNFPATLSYVDPSGFPQSVNANVSANVCSAATPIVPTTVTDQNVSLGASVFGAGFLPNSIFGWLLLLILILLLILLAKYLFGDAFQKRKTVMVVDQPNGDRTTTTTIHNN